MIHRQKSRISSQVTGTVAKNKEENVYWPPLLPVYLACILIILMLQTFWSCKSAKPKALTPLSHITRGHERWLVGY